MKIKQKNQVLISSIKALLISVVFLLVPSVMGAQTEYKDAEDNVMGTSDSRMVVTIVENGDLVELQVAMLGQVRAQIFAPVILYQSNTLTLIDKSSGSEVFPPQNIIFENQVVYMEPGLESKFVEEASMHQATVGGMNSLRLNITALGKDDFLELQAKEAQRIFTVYFKKNDPDKDIEISDLAFFCNDGSVPRVFSRWSVGGFAITYGKGGPSDNYEVHPELFTFRSASYATADSVSNESTTTVDLYGTFYHNSRNLDPADDVTVANNAGMVSQTGLLSNDEILFHGFIYTDEPSTTITADVFSNKLNIDGTDYEMSVLLAEAALNDGAFTREDKTFHIVQKTTSDVSSDLSFDDNVTLSGLFANVNYSAWSFVQYSFSGSNTYVSVSDLFTFRTGECGDVNEPIASNQSFCGDATVADLKAETDAENYLKWYTSSTAQLEMLATDALTEGTYYVSAVVTAENCESGRVAVDVTFHNVLEPPTATSPQIFCVSATVADLEAVGQNIKWYDSKDGVTELSATDALIDGATYYASQSTDKCTSEERTEVKVYINDVIPHQPVIPSLQELCGAPTLEDVATDGSQIVWYDAETDGNELPLTTPLEDGTVYYAAKKAGECESERVAVEIKIGTELPETPTMESPQKFCPGATLASVSVSNNKIVWYASAKGDLILSQETVLTDGGVYYAAQKAGDCESAERFELTVELSASAGNSPIVPLDQPSLCDGATLSDLTITGANIVWYDAATNGKLLPSNTILVDKVSYFAAQSTGNCQSSLVEVIANITLPERPVVSFATQSFCKDATISDLRATVAAGSTLVWYEGANTTAVPEGTKLENDLTYFAKAIFGGCPSEVSIGVQVSIVGDLNAPVATSPQTLCEGATVANLQAIGGIGLKWYESKDGGDPLPTSELLEDGAIYYASQSAGSCESPERTAVKVILDDDARMLSPNIPNTSQTLCDQATLADVATDGNTNIVWYADIDATDRLSLDYILPVGESSFYAALALGGCESVTRAKVELNVKVIGARPTEAPDVTTPQTFCSGATLASVAVPNNQIVWYLENGTTPLDLSTILVTGVYQASQKAGNCETALFNQKKVTINVTSGASAPIANSPQSFKCGGTVADLKVVGSNVDWYETESGGTPLALDMVLERNKNYYAAQGAGNCQSLRTLVAVTFGVLEAPVAQARQLFCEADELVVANLIAEGEGIKWYELPTSTQSMLNGDAIEIGKTYYAAQTDGSCISARTAVTVGVGIEIVQKDNHILVINNNSKSNGGFDFTYYVWSKDGKEVAKGAWGTGEGGGYYVEGTLNGPTLKESSVYTAKLTAKDGSTYNTCPFIPTINKAKGSISVYPNPLVSSQVVYVDADMEDSVLETAYVEILSPIGSYIGKVKAQRVTPVYLPEEKGVYVLKFISSEKEEYFKIIVK